VDKKIRYNHKNVHDIMIGDSFVRLWDAKGTANRNIVIDAFQHLLRTGFVHPYVALMPDYHPGEGSIPTEEVLLPSVIGGDLGCGMIAIRLPIHADAISSRFQDIQKKIRNGIPTGTAHNAAVIERVEKNAIWERDLRAPLLTNRVRRKLLRQFASLGGGNHFIEIQCDQENRLWIMLHSGSRYLTRSTITCGICGLPVYFRLWDPSYFSAMSFQYQRMTVSGVNNSAHCSSIFRLSRFALDAIDPFGMGPFLFVEVTTVS
jgi:hypothetical protein